MPKLLNKADGLCPCCWAAPCECKIISFCSPPMALPMGTPIKHERYYLGGVLGQGGFGITYLAWDHAQGKRVVVKEFFPLGHAHRANLMVTVPGNSKKHFTKYMNAFAREMQVAGSISHDNVVQVLDDTRENGTYYYMMPYLQGCTLQDAIRSLKRLSEKQILELLYPLCDGLALLHRKKVIHRDIKPANILLNDRRLSAPVLLDFGAVTLSYDGNTIAVTVFMTPGYAPPEQSMSSSKVVGPWIDVYALAATLYECAVGSPPPEGRLSQESPLFPNHVKLSNQLREALSAGLQLDYRQRPQSIAQFLAYFSPHASIHVEPKTKHHYQKTHLHPGLWSQLKRILSPLLSEPPKLWWYIYVKNGDHISAKHKINTVAIIGRDTEKCTLILEDKYISRIHARLQIAPDGTGVYLEDMQSCGGVYIYEQTQQAWRKIEGAIKLQSGDLFSLTTPDHIVFQLGVERI